VLLRLLVVAVIVVVGRLPVVMRRRLMLGSGIVMVFAGRVLLFLGHGNFLLGQQAFESHGAGWQATTKAGMAERSEAFHHAGLLV